MANLIAAFNFELNKQELLVVTQALTCLRNTLQRDGLLEEQSFESEQIICDSLVSLISRTLNPKFNYWSVQAGPVVQTHRQLLPTAEIGTAQHHLKIMGLRKFVAQQLINTAKVLSEDTTKEKVAATVTNLRIGLAAAIMPKSSSVRKY